jgi:DNA-binding MarR family transcriptional regulator
MQPVGTVSAADLVAALHRFGLERDRLRVALARRARLPIADLDALEHLELAGALSQRDLAERLLLTSGAVTLLVDRLERAGLVVRRAHPTDRRVSLVELVPSPAAPELPELDRYHATVQTVAAALPATARGQVLRFLTEVTAGTTAATEELRTSTR